MNYTGVETLRPRWMVHAACGDADRTIFYPVSAPYTKARAYCNACEVSGECLAWALEAEGFADHGGRHGMFGGTTPREREAMRPERICVICELPFRGDPRTRTCSERCWKVNEARYQRVWNRANRSSSTPGSHGGHTMYRNGCRCSVCLRWKKAKAREEAVRREMRQRRHVA